MDEHLMLYVRPAGPFWQGIVPNLTLTYLLGAPPLKLAGAGVTDSRTDATVLMV